MSSEKGRGQIVSGFEAVLGSWILFQGQRVPLKSFMVGKVTQRFFVFLFLKIQHSSENGRSGYKKDKREREAATASSRHVGTGRPRQRRSGVEEMWAAGVRTQSERKSGRRRVADTLPQQERFAGMGKERVWGVGGHDRASCFGLVNFEMLPRYPRRDAKWPVG